MSIDGRMCRICLAPQRTSKFNQIFGNNGRLARQIFEISGLKILEFKACQALVCPKCTGNLQRAAELRAMILASNKNFNEIYKHCRFSELDVQFESDDEEESPTDQEAVIEIQDIDLDSGSSEVILNTIAENYRADDDSDVVYIDNIESGNHESGTYFQIQTVMKEDPDGSIDDDFNFDELPADVIIALDDEYLYDLREAEQSTTEAPIPCFCHVCGYKSINDLDLDEHLQLMHNRKKRKLNRNSEYLCCYCGMVFKSKIERNQHRENEHLEEETSLTCQICTKAFNQPSHLRIHMAYRHTDKKLNCPKCGKYFAKPHDFEVHLKVVHSKPSFVCQVCSESFVLRQQLTNHMREHKSKKKYSCEVCEFGCMTLTVMRRHVEEKHPRPRLVRCRICDQTFTSKENFRGHLIQGKCIQKEAQQ